MYICSVGIVWETVLLKVLLTDAVGALEMFEPELWIRII